MFIRCSTGQLAGLTLSFQQHVTHIKAERTGSPVLHTLDLVVMQEDAPCAPSRKLATSFSTRIAWPLAMTPVMKFTPFTA